MRRTRDVIKRTAIAFYRDQMTQHAAAITYYSLMSLFPVLLLALSLLGVVGEYPRTYNAIVDYLRGVAPESVVQPIDSSLRVALRNKSTATTGLIVSILIAFYGTTGVLESMRRALNVAFRVQGGRSFVRRKAVDIGSTFVLLALVLTTLVFVVVGRELAVELFDLVGLDRGAAPVWEIVRWPAAVISAMLGFSFIYYVTPDYKHRAFHLVTPGAVLGVTAWLLVSYALSQYISNVVNVGALYGTFTGAIVVVIWLWLSSCALLVGAELNAAFAVEAHGRRTPEAITEVPLGPVVPGPAPGGSRKPTGDGPTDGADDEAAAARRRDRRSGFDDRLGSEEHPGSEDLPEAKPEDRPGSEDRPGPESEPESRPGHEPEDRHRPEPEDRPGPEPRDLTGPKPESESD